MCRLLQNILTDIFRLISLQRYGDFPIRNKHLRQKIATNISFIDIKQ